MLQHNYMLCSYKMGNAHTFGKDIEYSVNYWSEKKLKKLLNKKLNGKIMLVDNRFICTYKGKLRVDPFVKWKISISFFLDCVDKLNKKIKISDLITEYNISKGTIYREIIEANSSVYNKYDIFYYVDNNNNDLFVNYGFVENTTNNRKFKIICVKLLV